MKVSSIRNEPWSTRSLLAAAVPGASAIEIATAVAAAKRRTLRRKRDALAYDSTPDEWESATNMGGPLRRVRPAHAPIDRSGQLDRTTSTFSCDIAYSRSPT